MDTLKAELFERPFYLLFLLAFLEIGLLVWWRSRRTGRAALALVAPPLLAGAILLTAHLVVTDRERLQQAVASIAQEANAHRVDTLARQLGPEVLFALREGVEPVPMPADQVCRQARGAMEDFDVTSVKVVSDKVDFPADRSARMLLTLDVDLRQGGLVGTVRLAWTLRWALRQGRWQILEAQPTGTWGRLGR